jgi:hypothetical protein
MWDHSRWLCHEKPYCGWSQFEAKIFELYNCETFRARCRRQQFHNMNWGQERNLVAVV